MTKKEIAKLKALRDGYLEAINTYANLETQWRKEGKDITSVRTARMCYNTFTLELDGLLKGKE